MKKKKKSINNIEDEGLNYQQKEILRKTKCLFRANGRYRVKWDLFIMILAIWNWFTIPVQVAFDPPFMSNTIFVVINTLIDIWFFIDILINFRTSFFHQRTGEEALEPKVVAINYLKTRFTVDLLATIPFDRVGALLLSESNTVGLQLFSLLKLVRVLRLSRIITYLNVKDDVKMSLKLWKLVFFLIMYLHCLGCLWYLIVRQDEKWIPPLDYLYLETNLYDSTINFQYWMSLYHAVLMLTGNDLGPRGSFQIAFVAIFVTMGAIINANIFGELAVLVSAMNRKATIFQEKIDIANTAMKNMNLPEKLQIRVLGFLTFTQTLLESQKELETFLKMISPSIREAVVKHIFEDFLKDNLAFKDNEDLIDSLTRKMDVQIFQPEDHIVSQGEEPDKMYFISKGQCKVYVRDQEGNEDEVNTINDGHLFGEVALLNRCERTATVKTVNYSTIASISKQEFEDMCTQYPFTQKKLKEGLKEYNDKLKVFQK